VPPEPLALQGAALKGSLDAKVAIIVYSDFQCPFCRMFAKQTLPALERTYIDTGKAVLAFRHLPLQRLHPFAAKAAEAAECARRQGRFWEMHDRLFDGARELTDAAIDGYSAAIGLKADGFRKCLAGDATAAVLADLEGAAALGISGTPTFLLGSPLGDGRVKVTRRLSGAVTASVLGKLLNGMLQRASDQVGK
jgi:protein-disulfide isomerase